MTTINLFDDQDEFVNALRSVISQGCKSVLGVASPAFGKTVVASYITRSTVQRSGSVWFLVHRKNLLRQTSKAFWKAKISHGLMTSGKGRSPLPVQVGTIGTVHSRISTLKAPTIMFVDEAHLARGKMFETVIKWGKDHGSIIIGLTGTPCRLDGKSLGYLFDEMIEGKSPRWLIENGRLSDYVMYSSPIDISEDLSSIKSKDGDWQVDKLDSVMSKPAIVGSAVEHWKKYAKDMITVVYCVSVAHSKSVCKEFNDAGIPAVHVDADTTEDELYDACMGLYTGKYKILCNCELVIEGFDLSMQIDKPITLECVILLRPTKSKARYLQMVFRALRWKEHRAVILDHAQCAVMHGLPDDDHEWSLHEDDQASKKSKKKTEEKDINIVQCKSCYFILRRGPELCPGCGAPIQGDGRKIEHVDGELVEIDKTAARKAIKREQGMAREIEDLVSVGLGRNMKNPAAWAAITYAARQGRKPTPAEFARAKSEYIRLTTPFEGAAF